MRLFDAADTDMESIPFCEEFHTKTAVYLRRARGLVRPPSVLERRPAALMTMTRRVPGTGGPETFGGGMPICPSPLPRRLSTVCDCSCISYEKYFILNKDLGERSQRGRER
jgi:hypothetical protein